jgi:hypothetical protein
LKTNKKQEKFSLENVPMEHIHNNTTFILDPISNSNSNSNSINKNSSLVKMDIDNTLFFSNRKFFIKNNNKSLSISNEGFNILNNFDEFELECDKNNISDEKRLSLFKKQHPDLFEKYREKKEIITKQNEEIRDLKEKIKLNHILMEKIKNQTLQIENRFNFSEEGNKILKEEIERGEEVRRQLHNYIQQIRGNIRVYVRVRPMIKV